MASAEARAASKAAASLPRCFPAVSRPPMALPSRPRAPIHRRLGTPLPPAPAAAPRRHQRSLRAAQVGSPLIALFQIRLGGQGPERGAIRDQAPAMEGLTWAAATAAGICAALRFQACKTALTSRATA